MMNLKKKNIGWTLLGIFAIVIVYIPVFKNGFVNWDDDVYILNNPLIQSMNRHTVYAWFAQPFLGLYQPFVLLSLAMDFYFSGLNPVGFHFTNLILHILNTILVFKLMELLFKKRNISIIVALLFGLHAMQVETVAWATERKNLLFVFFYLGGLISYIYHLNSGRKRFVIAMYFLYLASLISKASAVTFPVVLLFTDYLIAEKFNLKKAIHDKLSFFILAFIMGLLTLWFHYQYGSFENTTTFTLAERLGIAGNAILVYIYKLLLPLNLTTYNPIPVGFYTHYMSLVGGSMAVLLLAGFLIYRYFRTNKKVIWAIGFLIVNLGLFLIPPGVPVQLSDRYVYPAALGFFLIIAFVLDWGIHRNPKFRIPVWSIFSIYLLFIGFQTFQQVKTWQSSLTLWNRVVNVHGDLPFALMQRGNAFKEVMDYQSALTDYSKAIDIDPEYARLYEHRGHLLNLEKKYIAARSDFKKAIKINPKSHFSQCSLGFIYRQMNKPDSALYHLNLAIKLHPAYTTAYINRGKTYTDMNKPEAACKDFKEALSLTPYSTEKAEIRELIRSVCNK
ncbi:MAG: tetratricopeptide repeat protein [Bacteroidales bacterium]|nr:tetratricopeptide repeat protein [Bacteroidales bacterium]MCF8403036.1 tetratricopeptide repeat protein [Bacteroidales bacterium]